VIIAVESLRKPVETLNCLIVKNLFQDLTHQRFNDSTIQRFNPSTHQRFNGNQMSDVVISVENISKEYRLGTVSHNTMRKDMESWWARMRGKEDPNAQIDTISPSLKPSSPSILHSSPGEAPGQGEDQDQGADR
jgi:hypothetical protein